MVIGMLVLAAIPTVTGVSEAIAQKDKPTAPKSAAHEERQMKRFHMRVWCGGRSHGKRDVHKGMVVTGDGRLWVQSPNVKHSRQRCQPFEGFFVEYPDPDRVPAELGLVAQVSFDPPLLNWIFVDDKGRVCYGNRTESRPYLVGNWGSTDDFEEPEEEEIGGLDFEGEEKFVVVEPSDDSGMWEIWWDEKEDKLKGLNEIQGRLVLRISLDREYKEDSDK